MEESMGKPYSQDLRERVIAAVDGGTGAYVAAPLFRVSVSYVYKALIRRRTTGEVSARPSGCGPKPKLAPHDDALRERVAAEPDITLAELQAWFLTEHQVKVSIGCLWNRLQFLGLPLKKSHNELPSRIGRMSPRHAKNGAQARAN
jgi:transposase